MEKDEQADYSVFANFTIEQDVGPCMDEEHDNMNLDQITFNESNENIPFGVVIDLKNSLKNCSLQELRNCIDKSDRETNSNEMLSTLVADRISTMELEDNPGRQRLIRRNKNEKFTIAEKKYILKWIEKDKIPIKKFTSIYWLSYSGVYSIVKQFKNNQVLMHVKQAENDDEEIEKEYIKSSINEFVRNRFTPFTSQHIKDKIYYHYGIKISNKAIRQYLKYSLSLSFKKGSKRPANISMERVVLYQNIFLQRITKYANPKWLMINIDESSISRGTLKSRSWLRKGENWIIQNEVFRNSISIICSIISNGHYFIKPFTTSINSSDFMEYFKEMIRSVWNESKANYSHMLVILDNSSTHRSRLWLDLLKEEKWYTAFLPQYSPELAPVELFFSLIKSKFIELSDGNSINLKSSKGIRLIREACQIIPKSTIIKLWLKLLIRMKLKE